MNNNFIAHKVGDRFSVCNSAIVLVYNASRADALAALMGEGVQNASSILDNPAEPSVWFATLLSALQNSTAGVEASIGEFQQRHESATLADELAALKKLLLLVAADLADAKRAAIESEYQTEFNRLFDLLKSKDLHDDPSAGRQIAEFLARQPIGMRRAEVLSNA